jgi:UTP--glucose-1-phosphate uridylyltransferase
MPKEMLPLVDKPVIQFVVEEAVAAGLNDVLMVTGRNKSTLENHFDRVTELEVKLSEKNDSERLRSIEHSNKLADVHYVRQGDPLGLGHAVLRAKAHVAGQSFAVLLGDDIISPGEDLLSRMVEVHSATGAHVIALMEVPLEDIHLYGCAAVEELDGPNLVRIKQLIEKPTPEDAPSNLAVIGRYVLGPEIFRALEKTTAGRGGEIQLTDALASEIENIESHGVIGMVFRGSRFDTGDKLGYMQAAVSFATQSDEIGEQFSVWLANFIHKVN